MFKYTKEAIYLIIEDIKKIWKFAHLSSLITTTLYYTYAIIFQTGNLIINIILCSLFVLYTIFVIICDKHKNKKIKRVVKRSYKWIKYGIKAFTLGTTIYGFYIAATNISPISIILTTLMIILWIILVLLEIITEIIESKCDIFIEAVKQDIENIKKPVTFFENVGKKIKGEEISQQKKKSKTISLLEKRIEDKKVKSK